LPHRAVHPEWIIGERIILKSMKQLIANFSLDKFKKLDLPDFRSKIRERLNSLLERIKFKDILSLKSLIVLGFVIAVIPLFLAVMYAAYGMRETSALGRTINSQVFEQTKAIRLVMQKTGDIERKAKLFVLLSDPALRKPDEQESYETTRSSFKQALSVLLKLNVDNRISLLVNELSEKENLIYEEVIGSVDDNNPQLPVDELFQGLRESSNNLSREFEIYVDHEFNELRQQSESLEVGLLIKGAVLLFISFVFIALLLVILSRSIRQLDTSIRRLGLGELDEPIDVEGPSDLRYLGNRLEWLRTHLMDLEVSKQQFMHNVAIEIDMPLEDIRFGAEQLANETNDELNSVRKEIAQSLCLNVDKLKTVSNELVRFSQISAKSESNRKEKVNMKVLLDSVIQTFQSRLDAKSISLKKLVRPVEISGIQQQLRIIIEQLMSNAVKFSPTGGEIRIMLRDAGKQMELEVEDEGPGIEPDERSHVFEPFFRGKNAQVEDDAEGLGLGLAIVKEYVINHQGKVDIIDTRHDQIGARVRVQIPLTGEA
jgi:two-component system, NtrC family, sensor histidine kinase GlrK